jgi:hypothetical protein
LGCDYWNGLNQEELALAANENARFLVTGGSFIYDDTLEDRDVRSSGIKLNDIANYAKNEKRRFAFVKGCATACADYLSRKVIANTGRRPEIIIDTKSAVTDGDEFSPLRTYRFHGWGLNWSGSSYYRIVEILNQVPPMRRYSPISIVVDKPLF